MFKKLFYPISGLFLLVALLVGTYWLFQNQSSDSISDKLPLSNFFFSKATPTPEPKTLGQTTEQAEKNLIADQVKKDLDFKHQRSEQDVSLVVEEYNATHARGAYHFAGDTGSGWWLAFKDKGGWQLVFDGTGSIPCTQIAPYFFPPEIVPEC